MKKVLLLFTSLICFQLTTYAQLRFGLTAGLQASKLKANGSGLTRNTDGIFGMNIGGVAEYPVNDNISIRPELLFSLKGGTESDGIDRYKLSLSYIEIPIQAVYKYEVGSGKLVGGIGPYFGLMLRGTEDGEKIEIGEDLKGFDAGLRLLGGYELTDKNLSIHFFYNAGMANIYPVSAVKLRNSTFGVSVAYFLSQR